MSVALPEPMPWARPSVPAPGSSLTASTEAHAVHVRTAVEAIRRSFGDRDSVTAAWADILASRWYEEPCAASETPALQAAWALVSMRIVGRSAGVLTPDATIRDAETWFLGSILPPEPPLRLRRLQKRGSVLTPPFWPKEGRSYPNRGTGTGLGRWPRSWWRHHRPPARRSVTDPGRRPNEVKTALGPLTTSRGRFGCCRFNGRGFGHRSPMAVASFPRSPGQVLRADSPPGKHRQRSCESRQLGGGGMAWAGRGTVFQKQIGGRGRSHEATA